MAFIYADENLLDENINITKKNTEFLREAGVETGGTLQTADQEGEGDGALRMGLRPKEVREEKKW
jgi:hypothetical protein